MRGRVIQPEGWESWVLFNLFGGQGFVWRQSNKKKGSAGTCERILLGSPPEAPVCLLPPELEES